MRYKHQGFSRVVAVSCACLLLLPVGAFVPVLQGAQDSSKRVKQLVDALGAGADVTITLSAGEEFRGVISAIAQDRFALDTDPNRPESRSYFTYPQVRKLTLATMHYKASGETDPVAVKRILYVVGTGKHVLVRTRDSRKVRGRIQTIGEDQFILETGGGTGSSARSFQIAYQQVLEVKPKPLSSTAKTLIISAASVGAGILGALLIYVSSYQG